MCGLKMSPAISETKDVEVIKPSATAATVHPPPPPPHTVHPQGIQDGEKQDTGLR